MHKKILDKNEYSEEPLEDFSEDINGLPIEYHGKIDIKKANVVLPLTPAHIIEYRKCATDILYFAQNYFYIVDLDDGLQKIKLRDFQKEALSLLDTEKFLSILAARQLGKCLQFDSKISIRNKKTKKEKEISIGDFFNLINKDR